MSDVELICEKSFSKVEQNIVDRFVEFFNALIEADMDKLNEILLDNFEITQIPGKSQIKDDFLSEISDGSFDYSKVEIMEPNFLFNENDASLMGKVRLTAKIHDRELRWISNSVASFKKIDGNWYFGKWDC